MHTRLAALLSFSCALTFAQFSLAQAPALPAAPLGSGNWKFEVDTTWGKLPEGMKLGATHGGIVVDKAGNVYASSDTNGVFVFDKNGKFLRTIAPEVTNLHGILLREEGGKEYLYGALNNAGKVVKLTLDGKLEWEIGVPRESGVYAAPEDAKKKGAVNFKPTGVAIGPDGRIYIADGYGASVIHMFSADRKYIKTIGTRGRGENQFMTCHGIAVDTRYGTPRLLVADRENKRLVHLDLEGKWLGVLAEEMRRPCSFSFSGDYVAVAELAGRVAIVDKAGKVVVALGDNPDQKQWAAFKLEPQFWQDGIFIAPHGCAFDKAGNLYVEDWNFVGRLTKLKRVGKKA
jgi:DNA-binding beta-propeller fold protein YncE